MRQDVGGCGRVREGAGLRSDYIYCFCYSWDALYVDFVKGTRKYLLKEKDQDIDEAKRHLRK